MQPVSSAGKRATGVKRPKNMWPVSSAGKHAAGVKRGKTLVTQICFSLSVCSDWLERTAIFFLTFYSLSWPLAFKPG